MKYFKTATPFKCLDCGKTTDESGEQNGFSYCVDCHVAKRLLQVPAVYRGCSFADFPKIPAKIRSGAYIWGPPGTGKTRLAWCIWKDHVSQNEDAVFVTWANMMEQIKSAIDDQVWTVEKRTEWFAKAPLLVVDDLGGIREQRATDWTNDRTFDIVDYRTQHQLRTVFTSNKSIPEIERDFDGRIASRLEELCVEIIPLDGADRRMRS